MGQGRRGCCECSDRAEGEEGFGVVVGLGFREFARFGFGEWFWFVRVGRGFVGEGGTERGLGRFDVELDDLFFEAEPVGFVARGDLGFERLDARGVEVASGLGVHLFERFCLRVRLAVGAGGGHRVERVGGVDEVRRRRCFVEALFVPVPMRDVGAQREERHRSEDRRARGLVPEHDLAFLRIELAGLAQNVVRHAELADVVHERVLLETGEVATLPAETGAHVARVALDSL